MIAYQIRVVETGGKHTARSGEREAGKGEGSGRRVRRRGREGEGSK